MTDIPLLILSLDGAGDVEIARTSSVSDVLWDQIFAWWDNGEGGRNNSKRFSIPLVHFISKIGWLRHGWTSFGYELDILPDVKSKLGAIRSSQEDFLRATSARPHPVELDLSQLGIARGLTSFQLENIKNLVSLKSGANFSVPGAGKTTTELVVWRVLQALDEVGRLLVVSPRSAFEAWESEPKLCFTTKTYTQIFGDDAILPNTEVLIVNYEQLENEDRRRRVISWVRDNRSMVVLDEAHRVKGGGASVRWRACKDVVSNACRVDLLTGTPMPQSYDDLRNLFCLSWTNIPKSFFTDVRLQTLQRGGVFVRTTKSELDLPPLNIFEEVVNPGLIQEQVYSALKRAYFGTFQLSTRDTSYFDRKGRAVMTLLAVATNPGLLLGLLREDSYLGLQWPIREVGPAAHLMNVVENYASHEMPKKYEWVSRFVEVAANENRKVLVWSTFIGNLFALKRVLEPFKPALIFGGTRQAEREMELERFRNDSACTVLLTNPQTLGEGISLHQSCHDAIYLDRSYNAGLYLQSLDRIHRLGLEPGVVTNIYLLSTLGTIDQRVNIRLSAKIDRLAMALDDKGLSAVSMPNEDLEIDRDELLGIDSLDLDDLFSHLLSNE